MIGFLIGATDLANPVIRAFGQGLAEQGFVEGRQVEFLYRYADFHYDRLPVLAADLVHRQVAVIVAAAPGAASGLAAKAATATIPIVFASGIDPVELGLVASFNRPDANITGATFLTTDLTAKRLELLHEIVPSAMPIGFLVNPTAPQTKSQRNEAEHAARILKVPLVTLNASSANEIDAAFATMSEHGIKALLTGADALFSIQGPQLAALAVRYEVAAVYPYREVATAGGLMSYGASIPSTFHLVGSYAGRILKGEKPADLPVQQSTLIEIVLNLKTAKAFGIEVPTATLLRATEVIE